MGKLSIFIIEGSLSIPFSLIAVEGWGFVFGNYGSRTHLFQDSSANRIFYPQKTAAKLSLKLKNPMKIYYLSSFSPQFVTGPIDAKTPLVL